MVKKTILDLCGGTGSWSRPYKEAGYDVRLVTLPYNDVLNYEPPENVYGVLAAPPCTEFSNAKHSLRDMETAMSTVTACLYIIALCRPKFFCIENPRGTLHRFLGKPAMNFFHWEYGELKSKPTCLWGVFNKPKPMVSVKPNIPAYHRCSLAYLNPKCPQEYKELRLKKSDIRAITPPGFAKAFFMENQ
jgi:hypothetical protein